MAQEKYEITKEAILKMAEKCSEAKEVLKAGFPQAFENGKHFNLRLLKGGNLIFTHREARQAGFEDGSFINVRQHGKYKGIAFFLNDTSLKWELVRDLNNLLCLTVERRINNG